MANPFDQFDPKAANPFDQFDSPSGNTFDQFDQEGDSVFSQKGLLDLASAMPFALAKQAQGVKRAFGDLIGSEEMANNAASAMKTLQGEESKVKMNLGEGVGSMAYQGVKGTLSNAPALAVGAINPALGLTAIGAGTGGEAYSKYRDRGASKAEAGVGGVLEGSIEAGTELLPMKYLLGKLGKEGFMNFVKGMLIREFPGEQIATLAQDAVDTAIANPNKTWQDYLAERPKAALATAIATGVQVGLTGGAGAAVNRLTPKGTDAASDVAANLDALDKQKEIQKQTQGEGTLYVGKTGDVTSELPTRIEETPEQIDVARTELQNNLQREATASQGEDPQLTFLNEDGTINYKPQELDLQVSPEGAAPAPTNRAPYNKNDIQLTKDRNDFVSTLVEYIKKTGKDLDGFAEQEVGQGNPSTETKARRFLESVERAIRMDFYQEAARNEGLLDEYGREVADTAQAVERLKAIQNYAFNQLSPQYVQQAAIDRINQKHYLDLPTANQAADGSGLVSDTGLVGFPDESGRFNALADVAKLDSYDKDTGEFDPVEYITKMRDSHVEGKSRAYKAIYDFILAALNKMPANARPRFALDIDPLTGKSRALTYDRTGNQGKDSAGQYDPNTDTVWIGRKGENEGTLVHETLHALTSRMLYLHTPTSARVAGLYKIYKSVINDPAFKGQYGTLDIHEFIAEVFSSPTFQAKLAQHQVKGLADRAKNTLHAIVREIVTVLGYRSTSPEGRIFTNALEEVIFHTEKLVNLYAENKESFDAAWYNANPQSRTVPGLPSRNSAVEKSVNLITGGAVATAKAAQSPPTISDPEVSKADQIESISGEVYIPKNPVIDEALINKIKGEKDGSTWNALTPGALAKSELGQSTLVKTVYRLMNGAYKRAEYKTNTIVKPAKDTFIKILKNPTKAKISHEILMRELKKGTDYTADELRSAGVSDDVIKAHLEFRSMMQQALEAQNAALRAKGLPEVKGIDAYISSRWSGPWRANIKDADGNIVWQVAEHSKKKAQDAIEWIKAKQPDLKFEDPAYRKGFERGDNVEAGYLDMLKMLDKDDPRVAVLESIYKDYLTGNTENVASQEKHHLRKKGVRGFAGDRAWSDNDVRDFFTQQFAYAENAFKWSEAQKSVEGVKELLNNPDLQESQKNNIAFSKDYVKNQLGFGTSESFDAIDNGLAKLVGTSPQKLQEYMGAAKTFFYLTKLGLSVPFTITQFLQPAITTPGWHAQLDSLGYKHNPIRSTFKSIVGGAEAALWHYGVYFNAPELKAAAEKQMNPLDLEAAKYMEANGIIDINPMTDIKKGLRPAAVNMVAAPFEFTIKHSEVIARSMAFMGFVDHLKQSGKFDLKTQEGRLKLFEKAEDMTNLSMTDYRTQERAMVFEKMGLTGDAAATLHSYQINNLMQLVKFGKEAKTGNVKPLIYMIGMQAAAAGLAGLWFVDDLDDLIDNLKKLLPHDEYLKMKDFSIKKFIMENLGDVASHGLVSNVTGTNIHTRLNASDQLPIWPFESQEDPLKNILGVAPFIESTYDVGKGAFNAVRPGATPQERWAGAYAAAPTVAQGPMENLPAFSDAGVSLKTKDLSMGQIRRTEEEKNLRNYGFRSVREQKMKDAEFQLSKVERELTDRQNTAAKKAKEYVISGEPKQAVEQMIRYDQLGGDLQALINGIPKAKLNRVTTELERRALASQGGTKTSILKLQRYMQSVPQ